MIIQTHAYARAGFLGNPSDGYYGKTISISVRNFSASILLYETPELQIIQHNQDTNIFRNIYELIESVNLTGYYGAERLIKAAIKKFLEYCQENQIRIDSKNFTIQYHTTIPRQVGLAGSSAIITATIKALMQFYGIKIPLEILPNVVLLAEVEELGINAGLQDRVIQSYEGCVYMDFNKKQMKTKKHGIYERIDPAMLPKIYMAYKTELGKVSGRVLSSVHTRYDNGDQFVIDTLERIAEIAEEGKQAILDKDVSKLNTLINENFDLRSQIMDINQSNIEMIQTARNCGASAKFAGSGGSIIGVYEDDEMLTKLIVELRKIKARVIKPYIE